MGSRYSFTGNTATQPVVVGSGVTQPANITLPEMATLLNQLDTALATLQTPGVNVNIPAVHAQLSAALDGLDSASNSISARSPPSQSRGVCVMQPGRLSVSRPQVAARDDSGPPAAPLLVSASRAVSSPGPGLKFAAVPARPGAAEHPGAVEPADDAAWCRQFAALAQQANYRVFAALTPAVAGIDRQRVVALLRHS